ncbi:MAG: hypothetical protein ACK5KP_04500 [Paludibacteraceae bacterium]
MKPTINKSKIMSEAWKMYKRANGQNAWICIGEYKNMAVFSDCLKIAWYFEKREFETVMENYKLDQIRKRVAIWQASDEYKAMQKAKENESASAWMNPETMRDFYNSNAYKGD